MHREPHGQFGQGQGRQNCEHVRVCTSEVSGEESNPQASANGLPLQDQVIRAKGKGLAVNALPKGAKATNNVLAFVVANQVMADQVHRLPGRAPAGQVVARGIDADFHRADLFSHQRGLVGPHHAHRNVGLAAQQVAHHVARFQLDLNLGQRAAHVAQDGGHQIAGHRLAGSDAHRALDLLLRPRTAARQLQRRRLHGLSRHRQLQCALRRH